ncbi:MAG: CsbD family protein [Burkholderiaceae bacterium]
MNENQVKGTAKDIAGKVQEGIGKATNSQEQQAKGLGKQVEGKTQKVVGDAQQTVNDATGRR